MKSATSRLAASGELAASRAGGELWGCESGTRNSHTHAPPAPGTAPQGASRRPKRRRCHGSQRPEARGRRPVRPGTHKGRRVARAGCWLAQGDVRRSRSGCTCRAAHRPHAGACPMTAAKSRGHLPERHVDRPVGHTKQPILPTEDRIGADGPRAAHDEIGWRRHQDSPAARGRREKAAVNSDQDVVRQLAALARQSTRHDPAHCVLVPRPRQVPHGPGVDIFFVDQTQPPRVDGDPSPYV